MDESSSSRPSDALRAESSVCFGPFQLLPAQRQLLESGKSVRLGNRAFEILYLLVERAGQMVSKQEILERVWRKTVVEEVNLRVHIAALRRALGDGQRGSRYIVNGAGRGYSFVATLHREPLSRPIKQSPKLAQNDNLPTLLSRMVGRSTDVDSLLEQARSRRLITIAGPAGVGKSTVGVAVARQLLGEFEDGVFFVDLGALPKGASIWHSCATALSVTVSAENPQEDVDAYLRDKSLLLTLDNCEHLIESVARSVERVLRLCPKVHILATTREPLNVDGEWTYRLSPLAFPGETDDLEGAGILQSFSAVELFVERATTSDHGFELSDSNAPLIARICRSLDGLPLAIELAAGRVALHGIHELVSRLDDHIARFASLKRTAPSRHQTLQATLDWSYEVLTPHERIALRRLAAFRGAFTMESAVGTAAHEALSVHDASVAVFGLADKSLLTTDISSNTVRFRLLNTTRAYALEKLAKSQDMGSILRWHAEQVLKLMRQAELVWQTMSRGEWVASYGYAIDDVRAALEWAFSVDGDPELGTALTMVSLPFGLQLALVDEFYTRARFAADWMATHRAAQPALEFRLRSAASDIAKHLQRPQVDDVLHADLTQIEEKQRVKPLLQRTIYQLEIGDYGNAVRSAERLSILARRLADPLAVLTADRVTAQAQHFFGNHGAARVYAERVMDHSARAIPLAYATLQVDRQVSMRVVLARILWLEGYADQAMALANELCELARADNPFALSHALAIGACPIALWCGAWGEARTWVSELLRATSRYKLNFWRSFGECFQWAMAYEGESIVTDSTQDLWGAQPDLRQPGSGLLLDTMLTIAPQCLPIDQAPGAADPVGWSAPERLRLLGEAALGEAPGDEAGRAEALFIRAIETADQQNALAWNLRASMSLARLWSKTGRRRDAVTMMQTICARFSEGFGTQDVRAAAAWLEQHA